MKKIFIIAVFVLALGGGYFFMQKSEQTAGREDKLAGAESVQGEGNLGTGEGALSVDGSRGAGATTSDGVAYQRRPLSAIYNSAEEALSVVAGAAESFDDEILDQFVTPGEDCSWCPTFYSGLKEKLAQPGLNSDERAYYAEILAISGRVENIETLIDAIKTTQNPDDADIYAEALEMTIGGDDVVKHISGHLNVQNEVIQEASVAALTNQGSKLAAETLYEHTRQRADQDGYYSLGIGLAEMIPDQGTLPYLQELMLKRDDYSHLAVKALLNYGLEGLVIVMDGISNAPDAAAANSKLLQDAIDHVSYDEETISYINQLITTSTQPAVVEFAKEIQKDFEELEDFEDELDDEDFDDDEVFDEEEDDDL